MNRLTAALRDQLVEGRAAEWNGRALRSFPRECYHREGGGASDRRVLFSEDGRVAGRLAHRNGMLALTKQASAKKHPLRRPPAWAWDVRVLREAEDLGATMAVIHDKDTGRDFAVPLKAFWESDFEVNRGHGRQRGLSLARWTVEDPAQPRLLEVGA